MKTPACRTGSVRAGGAQRGTIQDVLLREENGLHKPGGRSESGPLANIPDYYGIIPLVVLECNKALYYLHVDRPPHSGSTAT